MDERPSLSEIVERWLADNDGKIKGDIASKAYLFCQLFAALEEHGYTKQDARSNHKLIKESCFNENARISSAEKSKWKGIIEKGFERAMVTYPPWSFKMATFDPEKTETSKTQYPEMPESMKAKPTSEGYRESEADPVLDTSEPVQRDEFDPDEWAKRPVPQPLYDEELRTLFGFKK